MSRLIAVLAILLALSPTLAHADPRQGVAGATSPTQAAAAGAALFYDYNESLAAPAIGRIGVLRPWRADGSGTDLPTTAARIRATPSSWGGTYLASVEPNVSGEDNLHPYTYGAWFYWVLSTILAADPTAKFIGPNVLNWDQPSCDGCGAWNTGHAFLDALYEWWPRQGYGSRPPFAALGIHLYNDWHSGMPLLHSAPLIADAAAARLWLDAHGGGDVQITEWGSVWLWTDLTWQAGGPYGIQVVPTGYIPSDQGCYFLSDLVGAFRAQGVTGWYLFILYPEAPGWAAWGPTGFWLLNTDNSPSVFGGCYAALAAA